MHFLDWLDRHFASNSQYYYADDLGCPLELFIATKPRTEGQPDSAQTKSPKAADEHGPDNTLLQ